MNLKSLDVQTKQPATTTKKQPMTMALARMLKTVTTATANASQTQTVMESATHLKSLVAPTRLRPTMTHLQPTTMLLASNPFASILKHVTTPNSVETITASLCSHIKSMTEWWAIKTSQDMSLTESTSRHKTAMTLYQVSLVTMNSQPGSSHPVTSCKVHLEDCSDQTKTQRSLDSSLLLNTIAMSPSVSLKVQDQVKA